MGYLWTLVIVAVALIVLVVLVVAVLGPLRRMSVVLGAFREDLDDRGGMLAARVAALKVLLARRREDRDTVAAEGADGVVHDVADEPADVLRASRA